MRAANDPDRDDLLGDDDRGEEPEEHLARDAGVSEDDVSEEDERAGPDPGRTIGLSAPD